jgi:hypothetical protein
VRADALSLMTRIHDIATAALPMRIVLPSAIARVPS